jgi:hypothetical protein
VSFPIVAIALLSLDVCRGLVAAGYGLNYDTDAAAATGGAGRWTPNPAYSPLAITACTGNTVSPIVITTMFPHGFSTRGIGGASIIVSGVTGNTAANHLDADSRSTTIGHAAGVHAIPLTPTTLALYGQDTTDGHLVPLVGNGAWAGGGTVTTALTDGAILVGRENCNELSSAPRIVLVPKSIASAPRRASIPNGARTLERQTELKLRSLGTDIHSFEAHAWGQAQPADPAQDFVWTTALREAVHTSLMLLARDSSSTEGGRWDDEGERRTQVIKSGHLLSFDMTISVPLLEGVTMPFVPSGTSFVTTVESTTPEVAQVITTSITPG